MLSTVCRLRNVGQADTESPSYRVPESSMSGHLLLSQRGSDAHLGYHHCFASRSCFIHVSEDRAVDPEPWDCAPTIEPQYENAGTQGRGQSNDLREAE